MGGIAQSLPTVSFGNLRESPSKVPSRTHRVKMTKLYSYVLREDTGFAPNPYHGFCTLACCKGPIRLRAVVGDWIIGTGSDARGKWHGNHISYAMRVTEVLTFDEYWRDERFLAKRPNPDGDLTESCGDNIYQFDYETGCWYQEILAYHCESSELEEDTSVDRVLISDDFIYWGGSGPLLPEFQGVHPDKGRTLLQGQIP